MSEMIKLGGTMKKRLSALFIYVALFLVSSTNPTVAGEGYSIEKSNVDRAIVSIGDSLITVGANVLTGIDTVSIQTIVSVPREKEFGDRIELEKDIRDFMENYLIKKGGNLFIASQDTVFWKPKRNELKLQIHCRPIYYEGDYIANQIKYYECNVSLSVESFLLIPRSGLFIYDEIYSQSSQGEFGRYGVVDGLYEMTEILMQSFVLNYRVANPQ